ncbi:hypothetical protein [Natrinema gelatinilyticum]|nr:hypothetical protein [Natrinema gelatinilyticum]
MRTLGTASIIGAIADCSELALSLPGEDPEPTDSSDQRRRSEQCDPSL